MTGRVPGTAPERGVGHTTRQRVLVTGAASGLGEALTRAFRARGDDVLATDVVFGVTGSRDGRRATSSTIEGRGVDATSSTGEEMRLDITSDEDWSAALGRVEEQWGGLDVLVNNAGIAGGGRIDVAEIEEWRRLVEVNLLGVVRGCRMFTPLFKRQRSGHIVNVASLAGLVHPAGMASYNTVKAGIVALTETLGHELAAYGVTAHAVCPSYFRTGLMSSMSGADQALGAVVSRLVETSPLSADDVAVGVLAGLDRGDELILPDPMARSAYQLKLRDRPAYDAQLRRQAARLEGLGQLEDEHLAHE